MTTPARAVPSGSTTTRAGAQEVATGRAAVRGMLGSGDGTAAAPWRVLRLSDEYDVLRALGTRSVGQSPVAAGERRLDRHETEAGATHHVDVTGLV